MTTIRAGLARATLLLLAAITTPWVGAQTPKHQTPPAVQHYFDFTRPEFSGQRAYDQVAFMDQYFRWPGNTGFNASIHRVEDILKTAGYVEESKAKPTDVLTYRIEHRPLRQPAWEPVVSAADVRSGT